MKKILLTYHVETREKMVCDMIKTYLETYYDDIEVRVQEFYEYILDMYSFLPEVVYTFFPRDIYSAVRLTILKIVTKAYIVAVPTEGLMYFDRESMIRLIGYNQYSTKLIDSYCCWGERMINAIRPLLFEQNKARESTRFDVFGYLPYEVKRAEAEVKKKIASLEGGEVRYKIFLEKANSFQKTVMFIMGFHNADITIEDRMKEGYFDKADEVEIENARIKSAANVYYKKHYLSVLRKCICDSKDTLFVLKLHPVEIEDYVQKQIDLYSEFRSFENVIILDENIPISAYLDAIDVVVHYGSTTGLEAYIHKKPTIQLINDYIDTSQGGMGLKYFESTTDILVSKEEEAKRVILGSLSYVDLEENDIFLSSVMNYRQDKEYEPTKTICDILMSNRKPMVLSAKDKVDKHMLTSKESVVVIRHFVIDLFRAIARADLKKVRQVAFLLKSILLFLGGKENED